MERKQIDIKAAVRMYRDERLASPVVAKAVGCCVATLLGRLREAGVVIRSSGEAHQKVPVETLRQEYEQGGLSLSEIARRHEMNASSIYERLRKTGAPIRGRLVELRRAIAKIREHRYGEICALYVAGVRPARIAREYGVHKTTIHAILKRCGLPLKRTGWRSPAYKGGITPLHTRIRNCEKMKAWRRSCMEREGYRCQITGETGPLEVHHHQRSFASLLSDFLSLHPDLDPVRDNDRLFELAQHHAPFWAQENGITVLKAVHDALHTPSIGPSLRVRALRPTG